MPEGVAPPGQRARHRPRAGAETRDKAFLNGTDPHKGIAEALSSGSSVQKLARSRDSRCEKSSEPEQVAVTGDDRIGSGRQSALENPVIGLILVYEIHRLRRMNEDCEVIDRSLRLPDTRRRPPIAGEM